MALLRRGAARAVVGYDRVEAVLSQALELGAITEPAASVPEAVAEADVVVVATPVDATVPITLAALAAAPAGAWVTDVASVKRPVVEAVRQSGQATRFIGGHPMAGAERSGVEAADPYLFENAIYLLTPDPPAQKGEDAPCLRRAEQLVRAVGAVPLVVDPATHDRMVAVVSHLPHLAAVCLVETARQESQALPLLLALAAGGFRDTTRVAAADAHLWAEILLANAGAVLWAGDTFQQVWASLRELLAQQDKEGLVHLLESARQTRAGLPARRKGYVQPWAELVVEVQDRPGAIAEVTRIVAHHRLNLTDIEILRAREGVGGTLRLAFERMQERDEALLQLAAAGFRCRAM
ncbi:MAG: prephenate dehydrogenase/arogenate dehydrogenase family protein [Limnochordaceae bacterium]|nr:prephenate dehydrogenase/arogenate dehydrogenase family protein [Limnochordaceae bacterium]